MIASSTVRICALCVCVCVCAIVEDHDTTERFHNEAWNEHAYSL